MSTDVQWAERTAYEIAAGWVEREHPARVVFDTDLNGWAVELSIAGAIYLLTMPAPGAMYGLFRDGTWVGGMNCRSDASARQVSVNLLRRVIETTPRT